MIGFRTLNHMKKPTCSAPSRYFEGKKEDIAIIHEDKKFYLHNPAKELELLQLIVQTNKWVCSRLF